MYDLPTCKGEKLEYRVVSTIANTREAMGCDKNGFCAGTIEDTERL
jgi:hypothetical protein